MVIEHENLGLVSVSTGEVETITDFDQSTILIDYPSWSADGKRVYFTNALYTPWDNQFYPDGINGWMVKLDAEPDGGISADKKFFLDFGDSRAHQIRLQGGDASSDSFCYR